MWRSVLSGSEKVMLHFGQILEIVISFLLENNPIIPQNTLHIKPFSQLRIKIILFWIFIVRFISK